jgi:hypothetical protein
LLMITAIAVIQHAEASWTSLACSWRFDFLLLLDWLCQQQHPCLLSIHFGG